MCLDIVWGTIQFLHEKLKLFPSCHQIKWLSTNEKFVIKIKKKQYLSSSSYITLQKYLYFWQRFIVFSNKEWPFHEFIAELAKIYKSIFCLWKINTKFTLTNISKTYLTLRWKKNLKSTKNAVRNVWGLAKCRKYVNHVMWYCAVAWRDQ